MEAAALLPQLFAYVEVKTSEGNLLKMNYDQRAQVTREGPGSVKALA